jgi:hypothetical protein
MHHTSPTTCKNLKVHVKYTNIQPILKFLSYFSKCQIQMLFQCTKVLCSDLPLVIRQLQSFQIYSCCLTYKHDVTDILVGPNLTFCPKIYWYIICKTADDSFGV